MMNKLFKIYQRDQRIQGFICQSEIVYTQDNQV